MFTESSNVVQITGQMIFPLDRMKACAISLAGQRFLCVSPACWLPIMLLVFEQRQVFLPAERHLEEMGDRQVEMERAFEDMYLEQLSRLLYGGHLCVTLCLSC